MLFSEMRLGFVVADKMEEKEAIKIWSGCDSLDTLCSVNGG